MRNSAITHAKVHGQQQRHGARIAPGEQGEPSERSLQNKQADEAAVHRLLGRIAMQRCRRRFNHSRPAGPISRPMPPSVPRTTGRLVSA